MSYYQLSGSAICGLLLLNGPLEPLAFMFFLQDRKKRIKCNLTSYKKADPKLFMCPLLTSHCMTVMIDPYQD